MSSKMKFLIMLTCLALVFFVTPANSFAGTQLKTSSALQTILDQAEATYMKPLGFTTQTAINKDPDIFAGLVGMTLQRQFNYLRSNGDYIRQYKVLENEALIFLNQLAKAHNYRHPTDGSNLPEARMGVEFYRGLNGDSNGYFIEKFGIDPANVKLPFMLSQVPPPKNTGGDGVTPHGRLHVKEKNEIKIFGEVMSAASSKPAKDTPVASDHPFPTGQCPKQSSEEFFIIDSVTNQIVKSPTASCTWCSYKNGLLYSETPQVNGKKHGMKKSFRIDKGPYYMTQSTPYTNDKEEGIQETYRYDHESGRVYLSSRTPYKSGLRHGTQENHAMDKGIYYQDYSRTWVNGKLHGVCDTGATATSGSVTKRFLKWRKVYVHGKKVESFIYDINGNIEFHETY